MRASIIVLALLGMTYTAEAVKLGHGSHGEPPSTSADKGEDNTASLKEGEEKAADIASAGAQ